LYVHEVDVIDARMHDLIFFSHLF